VLEVVVAILVGIDLSAGDKAGHIGLGIGGDKLFGRAALGAVNQPDHAVVAQYHARFDGGAAGTADCHLVHEKSVGAVFAQRGRIAASTFHLNLSM
jgi:hypothetical protein